MNPVMSPEQHDAATAKRVKSLVDYVREKMKYLIGRTGLGEDYRPMLDYLYRAYKESVIVSRRLEKKARGSLES